MRDEDQTIGYVTPRLWTARCFGCDTFFEAETQNEAREKLVAHQTESGHKKSYAIVVPQPTATT